MRLIGSTAVNRHAVKFLPTEVDGGRKAKLLHDAYRAAKDADASISQVRASLTGRDVDVTILNSEGLYVCGPPRVHAARGISAVASDGGENQTGFAGPGAMAGMELFSGTARRGSAGARRG